MENKIAWAGTTAASFAQAGKQMEHQVEIAVSPSEIQRVAERGGPRGQVRHGRGWTRGRRRVRRARSGRCFCAAAAPPAAASGLSGPWSGRWPTDGGRARPGAWWSSATAANGSGTISRDRLHFTLADGRAAKPVEILDFYHAAENLGKAREEIFADGESPPAKAWFAQWRHRLRQGEVEAVIGELERRARAAQDEKRRGALRVRKNYFAGHRERMRYPQL